VEYVGASAGAEQTVRREFDAVVRTFERRTGRLWARRTGHVREFFIPRILPQRRGSLFIEEPNVSVTLIEQWWDSPDDRVALALFDETTGTGEYRLRINGPHVVEIVTEDWVWRPNVRVTFDCGYSATGASALPDELADVRAAIKAQTAFQLARNSKDFISVSSRTLQGSTTTLLDGPHHPTFLAAIEDHRAVLL
jgi:hypothetical protein